jgi:hypothetical protein
MEIQEVVNRFRLCLNMLDWRNVLPLVDCEGEEERGSGGGRIQYKEL